jgi:16S rRNA (adenine1518-N6/adenine1519-N6)-dimethyltransferase
MAIEIDPGCVAALRATCRGATNLEVLQVDIRKTDTGRLFRGHRYRVVGNLPYYLTGMVLPQLLSATPPPADVTVLVQREVAQRLAGPPGDWSLATLGVRILADAALLLAVPAAAFMPPPRVASALIRLTPKSAPAVPPGEQPSFFAFAEAFFQARRKQLHHAWAHATGATPARARESLRQLGIDPARRPQTLSLAEWTLLYRRAAGGKVGGTIRA